MPKEITEENLYAPVRRLGDLLRTRKLSPVALTEAYLDRLAKIGPRLGAVVTIKPAPRSGKSGPATTGAPCMASPMG
jgi:Asp-tRNA(Asn)/Glu-tRNA(Gln) amidotransferase A subunit family amidase